MRCATSGGSTSRASGSRDLANSSARMRDVKTVPLSEAKDRLSALVEEADSTHEIVQITRHGRPAAVLMSADDLESLQETIYWLSLIHI